MKLPEIIGIGVSIILLGVALGALTIQVTRLVIHTNQSQPLTMPDNAVQTP